MNPKPDNASADVPTKPKRRWLRLTLRTSLMVMLAIALVYGSPLLYVRYRYPYGFSHCCDKNLALILRQYADQHDGWFPRGEDTPEASLSLLYPQLADCNLLRGKTVLESVVRARLDAGELLTPETCGWHYIDGLRADDDQRLALFWDKAGLGHNGERLSGGGHYVGFVGGWTEYIPGPDWEGFVAEQERLRAVIKRGMKR